MGGKAGLVAPPVTLSRGGGPGLGALRSVRTFRPPTGGPSGSLGLAGTRVMLTTAGTSPSSGSLLVEVLEVLEVVTLPCTELGTMTGSWGGSQAAWSSCLERPGPECEAIMLLRLCSSLLLTGPLWSPAPAWLSSVPASQSAAAILAEPGRAGWERQQSGPGQASSAPVSQSVSTRARSETPNIQKRNNFATISVISSRARNTSALAQFSLSLSPQYLRIIHLAGQCLSPLQPWPGPE